MAEISRVDAAAKMFGKGSKQHKAAMKKYGSSGGPKAQVMNAKKSGTTKSVKGRSQSRDRKGRWN